MKATGANEFVQGAVSLLVMPGIKPRLSVLGGHDPNHWGADTG